MDELRTDPRPLLCTIATLAALALAGCGEKEEPATGGSSGSSKPAAAKKSGGGKEGTTKVALGEEATLSALEGEMKVRVTKVIDPLPNPATERPRRAGASWACG